MSLQDSIIDEFRRTPVAATSGALGALIAGLSLFVAWLQSKSNAATSSSATSPQLNLIAQDQVHLPNVLLIIAYFVAATVFASIALRLAARKHGVAAFFASVPLLALVNFSVVLVVFLVPPRQVTQQLFVSAHDLVFWASSSIVLAFCGRSVLSNLAEPPPRTSDETAQTKLDGTGFLLLSFIVLAIWGGCVYAGQSKLTRTLLPEIVHPLDAKTTKTGA